RLDGTPAQQHFVSGNGNCASHDIRILIMNDAARGAYITRAVVARRNPMLYGGTTVGAKFHDTVRPVKDDAAEYKQIARAGHRADAVGWIELTRKRVG